MQITKSSFHYLTDLVFNCRIKCGEAKIKSNSFPRVIFNSFLLFSIALAVVFFGQASQRTVLAGGRPEPTRIPPRFVEVGGFDSHEVDGSFGFISFYIGTAEHCALAPGLNETVGDNACFVSFRDKPALTGGGNVATVEHGIGALHPPQPGSFDARSVKNNESNGIRPDAVSDGIHGGNVVASPCPNFAVEMTPSGELGRERFGRLNDIPFTSPESLSVPVSPAAVELLRPKPARQVAEIPVRCQRHVSFIHGDNLVRCGLIVNTSFQTT